MTMGRNHTYYTATSTKSPHISSNQLLTAAGIVKVSIWISELAPSICWRESFWPFPLSPQKLNVNRLLERHLS